jgi:hypothetical protein
MTDKYMPSFANMHSTSTKTADNGSTEHVRKIIVEIINEIKSAENDIRKEYWIFKKGYQDFLGGAIFLASFAGIFISWTFYFKCKCFSYCSTAFLSVFCIMICTSFLHELEHDLIHNLYFKIVRGEQYDITTKNSVVEEKPVETTKRNRRIQDFMFLFIWIIKLHGNPWFRRDLHLRHHRVSGQKDDAEERLIGLGTPIGWRRMALTSHPMGGLISTDDIVKDGCEW